LSIGSESVKAILNGREFLERYEEKDGRVTISQFRTPAWYSLGTVAAGMEIQKDGGRTEGRTLEYESGTFADWHQHSKMEPIDAKGTFAALDAQFAELV
jgi:hypothetical protein